MTNDNRSIHWFEIPTTDLDRAARFYEAMLATKLTRQGAPESPMAIFGDDPKGVMGCLLVDGRKPSDAGTRIYLTAPDLDACVARAAAAGGTIVQAKTSIGPHGWIALVRDLDGNTVGLHAEPAAQ